MQNNKTKKMRKIIVLFVLATLVTQAQAQKLMAKDVPKAVVAAFTKEYPSISDIDWSKDGSNYEAGYDSDYGDRSVTYNAAGNLIETEMDIEVSTLPAAVLEYVKKNYANSKVKEASKITDAKGNVTYEAEVKGRDLIFDSNGNFIKSMKD